MQIRDIYSLLKGGLFQKILLFALFIVFITLATTTFFLKTLLQDVLEEQVGKRALSISKTISLMPHIINLVELDDPNGELQVIVSTIQKEIDAQFIVIGDKNSLRLTHPKIDRIGEKMVGGDNDQALKEGKYYISKATGTLGPSIRGKAPIFNSKKEIIGIVSVGYLEQKVKEVVERHYRTILLYLYTSIFAILLIALGFAKKIKKSLLGFEPKEISRLFIEKEAILNAVKEAIIATNTKGEISTANDVAKDYFNLKNRSLPIEFQKFLNTSKDLKDISLEIAGVEYICNINSIKNKNEPIGTVFSSRKKEEIDALVWELTRVKQYSERLREKKHEFSNLLHLISGYIQIGEYEKAIELITEENQPDIPIIEEFQAKIQDPVVASIFIGKYYFAFDKEVNIVLDENSSLTLIPPSISKHLPTILGNIINNAIDAAQESTQKEVKLFATDVGNDYIFEVEDSGSGIEEHELEKVFEKGYSTKGELHSGYGLYFVKSTLELLGGFISIHKKSYGTIITIHIPKEEKNA